eukprot:scaffold8353_cov138-Cylindrotheca_fusiformis.AAC.12
MDVARNRLLLDEEQKMHDIKDPHHNDVLCGRGVTTNRHPGNESFRSLVGLNKEVYVSSTKKQKMEISRSIVEAVRSLDPPGRFLEKNLESGLWSDIGHKKAVEKTSQALRDGAANLRKQLSADLGDPEFLNVVFDMDTDTDAEINMRKSNSFPACEQSGVRGKEIERAKEKGKENKSRSSEKSKPLKNKPWLSFYSACQTKQSVVKKGHRRANSNPVGGIGSIGKYFRRERICESPNPACFRSSNKNHPDTTHSACSTPLRKPLPHPRTPMTWSGRVSYSDFRSPRIEYEHQSPHRHYGLSSSAVHHPGRHHHGEHPHTPTDNWRDPSFPNFKYSESNFPHDGSCEHLRYPLSAPSRGHFPPPPDTPSVPPSGPLPPGRHHFSPAGYLSKPHPPDWSPRVIHHRQDNQFSPHFHSVPQGSRSWTPSQYSHDTFVLRRGYNTGVDDTSSNSLSVPSLGGEGSRSHSTRVVLAPRSRRMYNEAPLLSSDIAPDFAPPLPSPRFSGGQACRKELEPKKDARRKEVGDTLMPSFLTSRQSPSGEEKKVDDREANATCAVVSANKKRSPLGGVFLKPHPCYSNTVGDAKISANIKGGSFLHEEIPASEAGYQGAEENTPVEDIVMSPIPFDREDPTTLMELPENILTLPISACGPNDEPLSLSN